MRVGISQQRQRYSMKSLGMASELEVKVGSEVKNYRRNGRLGRVELDRDRRKRWGRWSAKKGENVKERSAYKVN